MHKTGGQTCGDEFESCDTVARFSANTDMCEASHDEREGATSEARCLSLDGCEYIATNDHCQQSQSENVQNDDDFTQRFSTLCSCLSSKCQNVHDACVLGQHVASEKYVAAMKNEPSEGTDETADPGYEETMKKDMADSRDAQLCSIKTEADDGIHDVLLLEFKITLKLILHCEKKSEEEVLKVDSNFKGFTCDTKNTEKDVEIIKQMLKAIKGGMPGKEQLKVLAAMKKQGGFATFLNVGHKGKLDLDVDMVAIMKELIESTTGGQLVLAELKKAGIAMKDIAAATGLTEAALTAAASSPIGDVIDSSAAAVTASLAVVVAAASAMLF